MSHNLAIITARGGSKRVPRKNIKPFCERPIILYSIEAAIGSGVFEEVMVSTDDEEIADIAREAGAKIPFMRSSKTAGDFATTDDVILEVLNTYADLGRQFDAFCCIYPTAPFLTGDQLKKAMELLKDAESVMPVVPFSYPPQRGVILNDAGEIRWKYPEYSQTRSQDLEKIYHDCGQFYACRTEAFLRNNTMDVDNLIPMIMDETRVQDIDTPEDFALAELKYKLMKGK